MAQIEKEEKPFIGYEYKKFTANRERAAMYLDCYGNFGWLADGNIVSGDRHSQIVIEMKRDRTLENKIELTRLQQHFEACVNEIETLEKSKASAAAMWAFTVGIIGTALMAGSALAVTLEPPVIWLCIVLAVPGLAGWILPHFLYHMIYQKRTKKVQHLIEAKKEELYIICGKGRSFL